MERKVICDPAKCTGCCSCYNKCPKNCITMVEDEAGYLRPQVDMDKCINCNLCVKTCPANNESNFKTPIKVYAGSNLDDEERKISASGGAAHIFSTQIIDEGGVVFGCAFEFDKKMQAVHCEAHNIDDIKKFRGSKYVQSFIGDTYKKVKENLADGKKVIFIGTPCQVDGLNTYLGNNDYENLVTVDIVCHGVPPMKYLKEHIESLNLNPQEKITDINFRGEGADDFTLKISSGDNILYKKNSLKDAYFRGFIKGLFYRESCYSCKYAQPKRVSDITLGDFWSFAKNADFYTRGIRRRSLIMINTSKGDDLFTKCKDKFFLRDASLEEAVRGTHQLKSPSVKHKNYQKFKTLYPQKGFRKSARICLIKNLMFDKLKWDFSVSVNRIKGKIKGLIKKILYIFIGRKDR